MINVIKGYAAIAVGKYWVGVASGNQYCKKLRRTSDRALSDAAKKEKK
jgi:hypothetical protein